jgi:DNA-binding NarL/FixJ family response regulator/signal transduction histidine kinase
VSITGHLRRGIRRHRQLADVTIALAVFAATVLSAFAGHPDSAPVNRATTVVVAAVSCGVLAARRNHPLGALVVSGVAAEVFLVETGGAQGVLVLLAPAVALYTVTELVERRRGLILAVCALAALAAVHAFEKPATLPQNLAFTALGGVAIAAGDSSRNRRAYLAEVERRAEHAEREREQDAHRRVAEERLRIARDLHDSVGHHLAVIGVQSDVAGRALDRDGAAAREALTHVKTASRKALEELRDTISLLRQPGDPTAPTAMPAPGLDALGDLLGSLHASGLDIDCRIDGAAVPLAPAVDLTAYRVVQESLTNVYKHSTCRQARLSLAFDQSELRIAIHDLGRDTGPHDLLATAPGSGGHGIVGMRERVLALGGCFTAGPHPEGAFRVTASLPYQTPRPRRGTSVLTIRVVIADDQPLLRTGFKALIDPEPDLAAVGEAGDGREAVRLAKAARADLVLMDIRMPVLDGLAATRLITGDEDLAGVKVLILTTFEIDEYVFEALRAGASGFLGKGAEADELLQAIRTVSRGDALLSPTATRTLISRFLATAATTPPADETILRGLQALTEREREITVLVATGLSNDEIAARLVLSPATVKTHVNRAMVKVGAHDRAQLVIFAYHSGLASTRADEVRWGQ